MWTKSENGEPTKPLPFEVSGNNVILRKGFTKIEESEEMPEHWTYDEWQMTAEQYEVYKDCETRISEQSDALVELAELISEVL